MIRAGGLRSRGAWALIAWLASAAMSGASGAQAPEAAAAGGAAEAVKIEVRNFMFGPETLTVKAGSTVVWRNLDQEPHTVVSDSGLFRSGAVDTNETFSFKFDRPGIYHYFCTIHPRMVGTVVVQ